MTTIHTDGTIYQGTDADDDVLVLANRVVASGGLGDDALTTSLLLDVASADALSTTLNGDEGDDLIAATLGFNAGDIAGLGEGHTATALLDGGAGADTLWLTFRDNASDLDATLTGGDGDDRLRVSAEDDPGASYVWSRKIDIDIDGGAGRDRISVALDHDEPTATIHGGAGGDVISSAVESGWLDATNLLHGDAGDDVITGRADASHELSGAASNEAHGGVGADTINLTALCDYAGINRAWGDAGDDSITLSMSGSYRSTTLAYGGGGADQITATATISGRFDGTVMPAVATMELHGNAGDDRIGATLNLSQSADFGDHANGSITLSGGAGNDRLLGTIRLAEGTTNDGHIEISGGGGDDVMSVRGGTGNILAGDRGNDTLAGGGGEDRLIGGAGADRLAGNDGADQFVFQQARGADPSERDVIADFHRGEDLIDVSAIDANPLLAGNQNFQFSASAGTGKLWVEDDTRNSNSILHADTGAEVLVVTLADGRGVHAADYTADDFLL